MKQKTNKIIFLFLIATISFILLLLLFPLGKVFLYSFFMKDSSLFVYYMDTYEKYNQYKKIIFIDVSYFLLNNDLINNAKNYLDSIEFESATNKEKSIILNYYGYIFFKKDDFEKSKKYLVEACKLEPTNPILINNLNFILSLMNKNNNDKNSEKQKNLSDNIEIQNLINIQNAENQIIRYKTEKRKESKNLRYW